VIVQCEDKMGDYSEQFIAMGTTASLVEVERP
jgi:hypothetical protein